MGFVHLLFTQNLLPPPVILANSDLTDGRYPLTSSSLRLLGREQVVLVPGKMRLGAGGRVLSFPDEAGFPWTSAAMLGGAFRQRAKFKFM